MNKGKLENWAKQHNGNLIQNFRYIVIVEEIDKLPPQHLNCPFFLVMEVLFYWEYAHPELKTICPSTLKLCVTMTKHQSN